jgi:CotH protein
MAVDYGRRIRVEQRDLARYNEPPLRRTITTLALLLLAAACHHEDGSKSDVLFAPGTVQVFELTLPPASLQGLMAAPREYQPGTLVWQGQTFERVGVRLKGRTSFRDINGKAAFKIKLDEFVPGQRLLGLRRLTLNNMVQDPDFARERLAYHLYREAGVAAPRCNSARLVVNGTPWGLYANVETLDDEFVEGHYGKPIGNLYDTSNDRFFIDLTPANMALFERETKGEPADGSDLPQLLQVMTGPEATFLEDDARVIDVDQFLRVAAVQAVIANWDGFFAATNNYEIYRPPGSGRFVIFPWGEDQAFGKADAKMLPADYPIDQSQANRPHAQFFDRCLHSPACQRRYLDAIDKVLSVWDRLGLPAELDAIQAQVGPLAAEGRSPPAAAERTKWIEQLKGFLGARGRDVRQQVAAARMRLPP